MKRLFTFATLLFAFAMNMLAEKTIYIPLSWAYEASTQEYTEDGDANKQWSFNRSKQSENCIVFWQKGFGSDPAKAPSLQGVDMTVDIDAVLRVAENCYNLNINKLGFANSNMLTKYKIIILMNYTTEWTCYGGCDRKSTQIPAACSVFHDNSRLCIKCSRRSGRTFGSSLRCDYLSRIR